MIEIRSSSICSRQLKLTHSSSVFCGSFSSLRKTRVLPFSPYFPRYPNHWVCRYSKLWRSTRHSFASWTSRFLIFPQKFMLKTYSQISFTWMGKAQPFFHESLLADLQLCGNALAQREFHHSGFFRNIKILSRRITTSPARPYAIPQRGLKIPRLWHRVCPIMTEIDKCLWKLRS